MTSHEGPVRVGVQLAPQHTAVADLRRAWTEADEAGLDSIWVWDHFFPPFEEGDGAHFEAYTLLSAMAVDTRHAAIGALVTCAAYRNPDLLADMARTIDHLSDGRFTLGIGAGWAPRDFTEYGYPPGTAASRLADLAAALPRIRSRIDRLVPGPIGPLPLLIGGHGERVTLRLVAEHADAWNAYGSPESFATKNAVLDRWCDQVGRERSTVSRTVALSADTVPRWRDFVAAGADHLIVMTPAPYDLAPALAIREALGRG